MKSTSKLKAIALTLSLSVSISQAAINFIFDYSDASNGSLWTQARKDSLDRAAGVVEGYLTNYNANIDIQVKSQNNASSNTLASASSNTTTAGNNYTPGFGNGDAVMHRILTGTDGNGATADGFVEVNWAIPGGWDLSPTAAGVAANAYDFESTMIHELLHAAGFLSTINQNGTDAFGQGATNAGDWGPFDQYVGNGTGTLIDGTTFQNNASAYSTAIVGGAGSSGLGFWGPNAMAANGGQPIWLYTPVGYEDGSSGSHLDDQFAPYNFIMEASTNPGPGIRTLSAQEIGMLKDIGYTNIVPEPSSTALLGLGGLALIMRRRK